MELHSYAKRRTVKKWTVEQKRKLVETRIAHDVFFTNKASGFAPWKNVLIEANLCDYNVFFVKKQWCNMLARYKQYKETRLDGNSGPEAIDAEFIKRINKEWEFFGAIHKYMTRKTTNLHSYAQKHQSVNSNHSEQTEASEELVQDTATEEQEIVFQSLKSPTKIIKNETVTTNLPKDCVKENIPNNAAIVIQPNNVTQDNNLHIFSSDFSGNCEVNAENTRISNGRKRHHPGDKEDESGDISRNTDHDFYSKRSGLGKVSELNYGKRDELQEQLSSYFADASEESQSSLNMASGKKPNTANDTKCKSDQNKIEKKNTSETEIKKKKESYDQKYSSNKPSTSAKAKNVEKRNRSFTERDKYYRHMRRYNRRVEQRLDAALILISSVVKVHYPNINVDELTDFIYSLTVPASRITSSESSSDDDEC